MNYESIDPTIAAWTAKHTLHLYTTNRGEEVRSVDLVGSNGRKCQIWFDPPDQSGCVQVHVWDYGKQRKDFNATASDLVQYLGKVYTIAMKWLS